MVNDQGYNPHAGDAGGGAAGGAWSFRGGPLQAPSWPSQPCPLFTTQGALGILLKPF